MHECVNWVNMNTNIESTIKHCSICLEYQDIQLQEKIVPHKILAKLWLVHIFLWSMMKLYYIL